MTEFAKMCFMNMRKSNFGKCEERKISVPQYIALLEMFPLTTY